YFGGIGVGVEIVTEDLDYFDQQANIADVGSRLSGLGDSKSPYIQEPTTSGTFFSWFDELVDYADTEGTATLGTRQVEAGGYTVFTDEAEFYSTLQAFLNSTAGAKFSSSVAVTADADGTLSGVRATAIQADYSGSINGEAMKQVDAMVDLRDIVDNWEFEAFPWSTRYRNNVTVYI
ncbi:unnamed protein product, partial [Sphacelaria rigidula]